MEKLKKEILKYFQLIDHEYDIVPAPLWLEKSYWKPQVIVKKKSKSCVYAIDFILSGVLPLPFYKSVVCELIQKHKNLRPAIFVLYEGYEKNDWIKSVCIDLGIDLLVYKAGLGTEAVVKHRKDKDAPKVFKISEDGWFPKAVLDQVSNLKRLSYREVLFNFINRINKIGNDKNAFELVKETLEKLMSGCSAFRKNVKQFMRLEHFESLLTFSCPDSTEHVFHSFRVFLSGCPIIDTFYDEIQGIHKNYYNFNPGVNLEYSWLLASVFHDIGRPKESYRKFTYTLLDDEDIDISSGKETRWLRPEVHAAMQSLGSFGIYVLRGMKMGTSWDGGVIPSEDGKKLEQEWTQIYDEFRSHAVIGAIDFLAKVFQTASASNETSNRPFVVSHAVPASLAILMHDWRIWEQAKTWHLFPVDWKKIPMAVLLIYLDTWDDYRRKSHAPTIRVTEYRIDKSGVEVIVEWGNEEAYEKEQLKYSSFDSAIINLPFHLKITHKMIDK